MCGKQVYRMCAHASRACLKVRQGYWFLNHQRVFSLSPPPRKTSVLTGRTWQPGSVSEDETGGGKIITARHCRRHVPIPPSAAVLKRFQTSTHLTLERAGQGSALHRPLCECKGCNRPSCWFHHDILSSKSHSTPLDSAILICPLC